MPDFEGRIKDFVGGNQLEVRRNISNLVAPLDHVRLFVKSSRRQSDDNAVIKKLITTLMDESAGQIIEAGGESTPAEVVFLLTADETIDISQRAHYYDIKAVDTDGNQYTPESGMIYAIEPVTRTNE